MTLSPWQQVNIAFPDWADAEDTALAHLAPLLTAAEADGLLASWFFIRKAPCWRVRYQPGGDTATARACVHPHLADLKDHRHIDDFTDAVYEPEIHAFGGADGMRCAHHLFHLDSRYLLTYLANTKHGTGHCGGHRRALSILLCSALLHAARLDWYEQGDVWASVADHREPPDQIPAGKIQTLKSDLRRLMTTDPVDITGDGSLLPLAADWVKAYTDAGRELADLAASGRLRRGLRAILTHHVIFAWNRHGLPHATQSVLANTAKAVILGPAPAAQHPPHNEDDAP
jgi:thiopeptide-type bacteriocin biosynthesis protein